jgi:glycosyltransferase involved in cell wall biosynthesis
MRVTLVTEGTYPAHQGGVSVWCDQLLTGLSEHRFDVYAVTGTTAEVPVWQLPANVDSLHMLPLWGRPDSGPRRQASSRRAVRAHRSLVHSLVLRSDDVGAFRDVLEELHELSRTHDMGELLRSRGAFARLHEIWTRHGLVGERVGNGDDSRPTLEDVLLAGDLIEHLLRPLWTVPAPSDLTHAVSNGLGALPCLAAKWSHGTPFLLTEHGVYLRERYLAYRDARMRRPVKALLLRFVRLLTSAAYLEADLVTPGNQYNRRWELLGGAHPARVRTVYNGVAPEAFPIGAEEPDVPTVTCIGRVDPLKDLETLIRAFALARTRVPNARLRMFGPTPKGNEAYRARCEQLLADLGLNGCATFEGRVERIVDAYHAGSVVALTSISEGFPYTVIEAMMAGRATVSSDVGGVAEAVADTGVVVPPRDVQAFADAFTRLLSSPQECRRLGVVARERALEHFTLARFLETYRDVYRQAAGTSREGAA